MTTAPAAPVICASIIPSFSAPGSALFRRLGRSFAPVPGMALAWNNLQADGTPNPFTLHEALPVEAGHKWLITKWFRADFGRNG